MMVLVLVNTTIIEKRQIDHSHINEFELSADSI